MEDQRRISSLVSPSASLQAAIHCDCMLCEPAAGAARTQSVRAYTYILTRACAIGGGGAGAGGGGGVTHARARSHMQGEKMSTELSRREVERGGGRRGAERFFFVTLPGVADRSQSYRWARQTDR